MSMISEIISIIEASRVEYCVLHDWQSLPKRVPSDLDIIIAPPDLPALENTLRNLSSVRVVQMLQHEATCFYFVLAIRDGSEVCFLPLDVAMDYRRDGRIFFTAEELLEGRCWRNELWVAATHVEFAYLLVKKVLKGAMPDHQKRRLGKLLQELGDEADSIVSRLLGQELGDAVTSWIGTGNWNAFEANLRRLKRALLWQVVRRDPLNPLRYWIPEVGRIWQRWRYPTGLFVAVLGPDGAGKSTLIQHLSEKLARAFRRTEVFHLRPGVLGQRRANGPVTDPHGKPSHPLWLSPLKVPYYLMDYGLGYLLKVRLKLVRSTLVLFDRYYDDLLVDPRRYRYSGAQWLVHFARRFVPRPDLFLILDVPEEQLLTRKLEVSLEELGRQKEAYRRLAMEIPNAILLDGSLPPEEVARNASEAILNYLYERYLKHRHLWFGDNGLETLNWLTSVLSSNPEKARFALPNTTQDKPEMRGQTNGSFGWLALKDGRGYLIPLDFRQTGVNALGLYNAQNLKGRVARKLLTVGLRWGVARPLLRKVQVLIRQDVPEKERRKILLLEHLKEVLECQDLTFAISLGTPGPYRKPVIQALTRGGRILGYVKVGWNESTNALVRNEAEVLRRLASISFDSFTVPSVLYAGWWRDDFLCIQSAPEGRTEPAPQGLTSQYLAVPKELAAFHTRWMLLKESAFWANLLQRIESVQNAYYRHILRQGARRVGEWLGEEPLPFHLCHGDFAPWNAQLVNGRLFLFDWEYADLEAPPGWDLFHFVVQTLWLLKRWSPGQICKAFQRDETSQWIIGHLESLGVGRDALKLLFLLYLLERLTFYASHDSANFQTVQRLAKMMNLCMFEGKSL